MKKKTNFYGIALSLVLLPCLLSAGIPQARQAQKKAVAAFADKNYAIALEFYREVIRQEPSYERFVQARIGHCYYALGDQGKALYYFLEHLKYRPGDKNTRAWANTLQDQGVLPDASGTGHTLAGQRLRSNHFFVNPGALFAGQINLGYERAVTGHQSLLVDGLYSSRSGNDQNTDSKVTTQGGGVGWRFSTQRLGGWFVGPRVLYEIGNETDVVNDPVFGLATYKFELTRISFGAELGQQTIYSNGMVYAFGVGIFHESVDQKASMSNQGAFGSASAVQSGLGTRLLLTMGYAF